MLCVSISHFFNAELYFIVCIYHNLFIHSPVEWHLGCYQLEATTNKAAMNISYKFVLTCFHFCWVISTNGMTRLYGRSIVSFLRNTILFSRVVIPFYTPTRNI